VIKKRHKKAAINPATGLPWRVWFVDNTSHSEGTFESPFPTLAQAQNASGPNDMIYVFEGDGTSNGMNAGIVLQDGQKLFGAGTVQSLKTSKGTIHIPTFSQTAPIITNTVGSVVFLGNGNEVSGMNIQISAGNGIDTPAQGVSGANLHHNTIVAQAAHLGGISLSGFGTLKVWKNTLIAPTSSANPRTANINVQVIDGNYANIQIENNICQGNNFGIMVSPTTPLVSFTTAFCDATISSNLISAFGNQGIFINFGMPMSNFNIVNNTIFDTMSLGFNTASINIMASNDINAGTYLVANNRIVTSLTNFSTPTGINIGLTSSSGSTLMKLVLRNNQVSNIGTNSGTSIVIATANSPTGIATICTTLIGNTIQLADPVNMAGWTFKGPNGNINIDSNFRNNIAPDTSMLSGVSVNFIPTGSCQ
jgi:hypothetical protein